MVQPNYSAKSVHNVPGHAHLHSRPHAALYASSRMIMLSNSFFWPFWSRCRWVLTIRLQRLRLRTRHYCTRVLYCLRRRTRARSIVSAVSQNLRFDGDFLEATKCFLQPQQKSCGWQLSSEVPSSVATFRATIEQPTKAHTAFLRGLVGQTLVRRPPALPALLLRPCLIRNSTHTCMSDTKFYTYMHAYLKLRSMYTTAQLFSSC